MAEDSHVDKISCYKTGTKRMYNHRLRRRHAPYFCAHWEVTRNQSSLRVKSNKLPNKGRGGGPGGRCLPTRPGRRSSSSAKQMAMIAQSMAITGMILEVSRWRGKKVESALASPETVRNIYRLRGWRVCTSFNHVFPGQDTPLSRVFLLLCNTRGKSRITCPLR